MEKNTILAIILASIIITVGMGSIQWMNTKYARENPPIEEPAQLSDIQAEPMEKESFQTDQGSETQKTEENVAKVLEDQNFEQKDIVEKTNLFQITFNTAGAVIKDILLVEQYDKDKPISMVLDGDSDIGTFNMAFGGLDAPYIRDVFDHQRSRKGRQIIHRFSRTYSRNGRVFTVSKTYRLLPDEYMIELDILLETHDGKALPLLDEGKPAYTLTYGPQIGPDFEKLDGRYEIREAVSWGPTGRNGKFKRKVYRTKKNVVETNQTVGWAGVAGKYFAVIAIPGASEKTISWDTRPVEGQSQPTQLKISRPAVRQSIIEDKYHFYIGSLEKKNLNRYKRQSDNGFGLTGLGLEYAPRTSAFLGWLESILRILLEAFYSIIPNYGVAILILTLIVKIVLYPFTRKSYQSTSRMQELQPKLQDLKERYKGDPQKINAKTAELYKAEGVNPMGGCLPMLFQFPIFIALYNLLNRYFPLRGSVFIPGWIKDLSAPEFIGKEFAHPLNLFVVEIPAIRLLPIFYLAGQLLMSRVMRQGGGSAQMAGQQKFIMFGLPIMFFFILYNMPSGLLLYWTAMNFISIGQQLAANHYKTLKARRGQE